MTTFFRELKRRNVVRVGIAYVIVCWLVVQIAEAVLPGFGAPEWIFKTLVFLLAIGFPLVLIFAWAFELTPEGLKKTREVSEATSIASTTGRKINAIIIASLAVALVYFIWDRQQLIDAANKSGSRVATTEASTAVETKTATVESVQESRRSIAVLPFVNMSSNKEQEWFADGLTEEILNSLARTPDLLVAARTSSFKYKESHDDVPTIAAELGVEHVLEGSVRRSGERLRVTAQLIRASDGFHLWSETYDRTMDDVIEIQEQVAIEIADALETAMNPQELARMVSAGTRSVAAYEAYLQGLAGYGSALATGDEYEMASGLEAFERAIAADPEFSLAYRQIAVFWSAQTSQTLIFGDISDLPEDELLSRYHEAIDNAIRFEENPVRRKGYGADKARMELRFLQALRLNTEYLEEMPLDFDAQFLQMNLLRELGRYDELIETIERIYELGIPDSAVINGSITALLDVNRPDLLRHYNEIAMRKLGDDVNVLYQSHRALLWLGDIDGAAPLVPVILSSDLAESNKHLVMLRQACAEGDTAKARRLYERGLVEFADAPSIVWLSHTIMSREEEAVQTLMPFDDANDFTALADFMSYGRFDATRYPNFLALLETQGIEPSPPQPVPFRCRI